MLESPSKNFPKPTFELTEDTLSLGINNFKNWIPLHKMPFTIFVGVTGVGKTTTLNNLTQNDFSFTLLPNRRTLTDRFILPQMAQLMGKPEQVSCRLQRMEYTRGYRQRFSGGMAHVLTQLTIKKDALESNLIFDGLRGIDEIRYAISKLPLARFVFLQASYKTRLMRLLTRNDSFDRISPSQSQLKSQLQSQSQLEHNSLSSSSFADLGIPEASFIFSKSEEKAIFLQLQDGLISPQDLYDKLKILVTEKRNYDVDKTKLELEATAAHRTLFINTENDNPQIVASKIIQWTNKNR